jgi:hypothetical protein
VRTAKPSSKQAATGDRIAGAARPDGRPRRNVSHSSSILPCTTVSRLEDASVFYRFFCLFLHRPDIAA